MQTFISAPRIPVLAGSQPMPAAAPKSTADIGAVAAANPPAKSEQENAQPSSAPCSLNEELISTLPNSALDALAAGPEAGTSVPAAAPSDAPARSVAGSLHAIIDPGQYVPVVGGWFGPGPGHGANAGQEVLGGAGTRGRVASTLDAKPGVAAPEINRLVTQRQGDVYYETHKTWVLDAARKAGLDANQVQKLASILRNSKTFDADVKLLSDLLATENPARALRTFNDLDVYRREHPDRITPEILRALTLGVGQARTGSSQGNEGILGNASAINAAEALVRMSPGDYQAIYEALGRAGRGFNGFPPDPGSDMQKEMALILKATAARMDRFSDHFMWDTKGQASNACAEVVEFAGKIRARDAAVLMPLTSAIDLNDNGSNEALTQRWEMSCVEATLQLARAEADPIFALQLNHEILNGTAQSGEIAKTQRVLLNEVGGRATPRGSGSGEGTSPEAWMALQNRVVSPVTGREYEQRQIGDDPQSRTYAVDYMEQLLKTGTDVPIGVTWPDGAGHALLVTDTRGKGEDREFLVTDPANGRTDWIRCDDIVNGNTDFFADTGTLSSYWF